MPIAMLVFYMCSAYACHSVSSCVGFISFHTPQYDLWCFVRPEFHHSDTTRLVSDTTNRLDMSHRSSPDPVTSPWLVRGFRKKSEI